jgi:autotransporter-associated beta strand protein
MFVGGTANRPTVRGIADVAGGVFEATTVPVGTVGSGVFSMSGNAVVNLRGNLTVGSASTGTGVGEVRLNGGTLNLTTSVAKLVIQETGTLRANGGEIRNQSGGAMTMSLPMVLGDDGIRFGTSTGAVTLNRAISGTGGVTANLGGQNTLTLALTNTFTGAVVVESGVLVNQVAGAIPDGVPIGVRSAGTWSMGVDTRVGLLSGEGQIVAGPIAGGVKRKLTLGAAGASDFSGSIGVGTGSSISLEKVGSGTQTLSGTSAYDGPTVVSEGTLAINGSLSATSSVQVKAGAKLGGTGAIASGVTVEAGASLALDLKTTPAGHERLDVTGSLTIAPTSSIEVQIPGGSEIVQGEYPLVSSTAGIVASTLPPLQLPAGYVGELRRTTTTLSVYVNKVPVANPATLAAAEDTDLPIILGASDAGGSIASYRIVNNPQNGSLSGTAPNLTYRPQPNFFGTDSFSFAVTDSEGVESVSAQVDITVSSVNDLPVATPQTLTLNEDGARDIQLTGTDLEGALAGFSVVTQPARGVLQGTPPNLQYIPALNSNGADQFTFKVADANGAESAVATVVLNVGAVNDTPSFLKGPDQQISSKYGAFTLANWAANLSAGPSDEAGQSLSFLVSNDANSLFSVQPALAPDGTLTFTPAPGQEGTATVTVRIKDNGGTAGGGSDTSLAQSFKIVVKNNVPPVATPATFTLVEDGTANTPLSANDADGPVASYRVVNPPQHGVLRGALPNVVYHPDPNYHGSDSFTFVATDSEMLESAPATVSLNVEAANDAPSFVKGGDQMVAFNAGLRTVPGWATAISAGPQNESAQTMSFTVSSSPADLFSVQPAITPDGTLTFTPAAGRSGTATVSVTLRDSGGTANGGSDRMPDQTFAIVLMPNAAPSAAEQSLTVAEDSPGSVVLQGSDPDGTVQEYRIVSGPAHGMVTGEAPNVVYTPAADYNGSDSFTFTVADNLGAVSAPATVVITVQPVNDAPRFTKGLDQTVRFNSPRVTQPKWATGINTGAADEVSQSLEFELSSSNAALFAEPPLVTASGDLSFTPAEGQSGSSTVTVRLRDNGGNSNGGSDISGEQTFAITVAGNQPGQVSFVEPVYAGAEASSGDASYPVRVARTGGKDGAVSILVSSTGGTATSGVDYVPVSQIVQWADQEDGAKVVQMTVKKDSDRTSSETVTLALGTPGGGVEVGTVGASVFTILEKADASGPQVRIVAPKPNAAGAPTMSVEAVVSDAAGIRSVKASVAGADPVAMVAENGVYRATVSGLDNGRNTLLVSAIDAMGNLGTATVSVEWKMVRPEMGGTYNGLVEMDPAVREALSGFGNALVQSRDGLVRLAVTSTGGFTGTLQMAGMRQVLTGVFLQDGTAVFGAGQSAAESLELLKKSGSDVWSLGFLKLRWVEAERRIVGVVADGRGSGTRLAEMSAEMAVYTHRPNPAAPLKNVPEKLLGVLDRGNYTAVFGAMGGNGLEASEYPAGAGVATLKLSKAGLVTLVGRLADGTAVSYSNALSGQDEWPVYVPLYGNRGYLVGAVRFDTAQTATDAAGLLDWYRPSGVTALRNYPEGWSNGIGLAFKASKYVVPARGAATTVLGLSPVGTGLSNIRIRTVGALGETSNEAGVGPTNAVTVNGVTPDSLGATGLSVRFDARTGLLGTSFRYGGVSCGIMGAVLQKTQTASGYFQYVPARVNPVGTAESGLFEITPIP